ncbi:hypothetical protein [Paenibacillus wynnii]|uniref:hypothetical protein n=1 Tax=Paenibacillus wynnii TaxID=268407 RepID=UPI0027905004|nr:hypothetical protein [Paenibacillus wynnii]MDQ0192811.1 hypothetical protein [Paenibacillus wynnii]
MQPLVFFDTWFEKAKNIDTVVVEFVQGEPLEGGWYGLKIGFREELQSNIPLC